MTNVKIEKSESVGRRRKLTGAYDKVIFGIAALMSLFQLYYSTFGIINTMTFRSGHLIFAMVLIFGVYPFSKNSPRHRMTVFDIVLSVLALIVGFYIVTEWHDIVSRLGAPTKLDIYLGIVATLLTLEIARRTTGFGLAFVAAAFLFYTYFGPYFPGELAHVGFPLPRLISQLYTTTEGIYGLPLGVMTNYVFLFILFATFLHSSGAGNFFIQLAYAATGRFRGGPAKTAIVASGLMGTISGAATANVVTTGSFTIPLMTKLGYTRETAGGIEVASSVGGQLTPPIMGAGAFIMAEWTGTPYVKIIAIAAIPAIMYYISVAFYSHIIACKIDMKPVPKEDIPKLWPILKQGFHFLIPLVVMISVLIKGYTPMMSAISAIVTMVASSYLKKETRMGVKDIYDALGNGAINAVLVSASLTCAGIIMCAMGLTGIGLKFSAVVLKVSGGNIAVALFLVAFASLFLGMELPITAAYITCAVLAVPALKVIGIPLITAHMIVFWFSMDSTITPPVCISAYAAAGISGGHPLKTGLAAWKMAKGLYIMPVLMAYTKLVDGTLIEVLIVAVPGLLGILCFNIVWEGFFIRRLYLFERIILVVAIALLFYPRIYSYIVGTAIFTFVALNQKLMASKLVVRGGNAET